MTEYVTSPAGHVYPADMPLSDSYGVPEEDKTPWQYVGDTNLRGNLSWEFDEAQVLQHADTKDIIIAADSGCSCPTPFENHTVDDGVFITSLVDFDKFISENESMQDGWAYNPDTGEYETPVNPERYPEVVDQVASLRKRVEALLNGD